MSEEKEILEGTVNDGEPQVDNVPSKEPEVVPEDPQVNWDKANLTMVCGQCGCEELVTEAFGGVTLFIPTNNKSQQKLVCPDCNATMTLLFRDGSWMTDEEKAALKAEYDAEQAEKFAEPKLDEPKLEVVIDDDNEHRENEPEEESK